MKILITNFIFNHYFVVFVFEPFFLLINVIKGKINTKIYFYFGKTVMKLNILKFGDIYYSY